VPVPLSLRGDCPRRHPVVWDRATFAALPAAALPLAPRCWACREPVHAPDPDRCPTCRALAP